MAVEIGDLGEDGDEQDMMDLDTAEKVMEYINRRLDYLKESRPTAVDLGNAIRKLKRIVAKAADTDEARHEVRVVRDAYIDAAEVILQEDLATNLAIGRYGAEFLRRYVKV